MSDQPRIQDDITVVLQAQKTVVHETVRINVHISAQIDPSQPESAFRAEVHSTLKRFIDTDWKIQNIQRNTGNQFENVYVQATARVLEKENYQLNDRAKKVSKVAFEVINPTADYSLTFDEIQQVNTDLRLILLRKAIAECVSYNSAFKDASGHRTVRYRVASSRFDNGSNQQQNHKMLNVNAMMVNASASPTGGSVGIGAIPYGNEVQDEGSEVVTDETTDFNVNTRFWMTGTFVLRAFADE